MHWKITNTVVINKSLLKIFLMCLLNFIELFLAVLDLRCCAGFSLVVESKGYSLIGVAVASLAVLLWSTGSIVVVHRLSCSTTCGIFLDQGQNPCLRHWQVDSLPLSHQGTSLVCLFNFLKFYIGIQLIYNVVLVSVIQVYIDFYQIPFPSKFLQNIE